MNTPDTPPDVRPRLHSSAAVRLLYMAVGVTSLAIGFVGVFLPVLPTTVFVLVAAYCFARSSERFHSALLSNRYFGPIIRDWQANRCISLRSKVYAITLVAISFSVTSIFILEPVLFRMLMGTGGIGLIFYLYSLPTCSRGQSR